MVLPTTPTHREIITTADIKDFAVLDPVKEVGVSLNALQRLLGVHVFPLDDLNQRHPSN
ncbi:hypothetical protein Enr13x_05220 [Stieleria neptunia]|uniref:Uncharacterized protein n=1 Tax=Stieleria neptunia TaxID=2527979 RepID=A0A518HIL4_9BACT|nr:hypothetical protein [Stieleria neptunia]QDV40687.1 hypothetical protein Enr13x_05220 [Stieleria neptunia]